MYSTSETPLNNSKYLQTTTTITCPECNKRNFRPTLQNLLKRFNEHLQDFRNKSHNSNFSKHHLKNQHTADTIDKITEMLCEKTIEKYYIYGAKMKNNQLNDQIPWNKTPSQHSPSQAQGYRVQYISFSTNQIRLPYTLNPHYYIIYNISDLLY